MNNCDKCGKPLRRRYWINPFTSPRSSAQCDRLWCRIRSGHWLWMNYQRKFQWRWTWPPFRLSKRGLPGGDE